MNLPRLVAFLSGAMLALAASSLAEDKLDASKVQQTINLFGATLIFPPPAWIVDGMDSAKILDYSNFNRETPPGAFVFEQIPKDDKFNDWRRLYAVVAVDPRVHKIGLRQFTLSSIAQFVPSCGKQNLNTRVLNEDSSSVTVLILCKQFEKPDQKLGYRPGMGEVGIFKFTRTANALVRVYHEWRGPAFEPDNPSTWPVQQKEYEMMVQRFRHVRLVPAKQ